MGISVLAELQKDSRNSLGGGSRNCCPSEYSRKIRGKEWKDRDIAVQKDSRDRAEGLRNCCPSGYSRKIQGTGQEDREIVVPADTPERLEE